MGSNDQQNVIKAIIAYVVEFEQEMAKDTIFSKINHATSYEEIIDIINQSILKYEQYLEHNGLIEAIQRDSQISIPELSHVRITVDRTRMPFEPTLHQDYVNSYMSNMLEQFNEYCQDAVVPEYTSTSVDDRVVPSRKIYSCPELNCEYIAYNLRALKKHTRESHNTHGVATYNPY